MTKTEIMLTMHDAIPNRIFRTIHLGGDASLLKAMADDGLISRKRAGSHDWFLSKEQHAALSFLFAD